MTSIQKSLSLLYRQTMLKCAAPGDEELPYEAVGESIAPFDYTPGYQKYITNPLRELGARSRASAFYGGIEGVARAAYAPTSFIASKLSDYTPPILSFGANTAKATGGLLYNYGYQPIFNANNGLIPTLGRGVEDVSTGVGRSIGRILHTPFYDPTDTGPLAPYADYMLETEKAEALRKAALKLRRRIRLLKNRKEKEEALQKHVASARYT